MDLPARAPYPHPDHPATKIFRTARRQVHRIGPLPLILIPAPDIYILPNRHNARGSCEYPPEPGPGISDPPSWFPVSTTLENMGRNLPIPAEISDRFLMLDSWRGVEILRTGWRRMDNYYPVPAKLSVGACYVSPPSPFAILLFASLPLMF